MWGTEHFKFDDYGKHRDAPARSPFKKGLPQLSPPSGTASAAGATLSKDMLFQNGSYPVTDEGQGIKAWLSWPSEGQL